MPIVVTLDQVMVRRKVKSRDLAAFIGITDDDRPVLTRIPRFDMKVPAANS